MVSPVCPSVRPSAPPSLLLCDVLASRSGSSFWPIPEPFWVDRSTEPLPARREAQPELVFRKTVGALSMSMSMGESLPPREVCACVYECVTGHLPCVLAHLYALAAGCPVNELRSKNSVSAARIQDMEYVLCCVPFLCTVLSARARRMSCRCCGQWCHVMSVWRRERAHPFEAPFARVPNLQHYICTIAVARPCVFPSHPFPFPLPRLGFGRLVRKTT